MAARDIGVYVFEVGQGSSAAIVNRIPGRGRRTSQATVLDVGVSGTRLAQLLQTEFRVQRLLAVALTHNHEDHVKGLAKLVEAYAGRIGKLWFLMDRSQPPPFWLPVQTWQNKRLIRSHARLEAPAEIPPGLGEPLVDPTDAGYGVYCIYPTLTQNEAVVHRAEQLAPPLGHDQNATSAVLRLTRAGMPEQSVVLFGGDLDYRAWRQLSQTHDLRATAFVAPHHGGARGETPAFGHSHLAQEVRPTYVLFSAGTQQRHVKPGHEATARHPLPDVVRAFRGVNATVLCTQLTDRCHDHPEAYPDRTVLPLVAGDPNLDLSPSGTACAGTILITVPEGGQPTVYRLHNHQAAVNQLQPAGHHPLCRP